jgi:hypothetical protein
MPRLRQCSHTLIPQYFFMVCTGNFSLFNCLKAALPIRKPFLSISSWFAQEPFHSSAASRRLYLSGNHSPVFLRGLHRNLFSLFSCLKAALPVRKLDFVVFHNLTKFQEQNFKIKMPQHTLARRRFLKQPKAPPTRR